MRKADVYLVLSIIVLLLFSVTVIIFDGFGLQVQEQLIIGMFGFFGTEIAACCLIKVFNVKYGDDHVDGISD